jgi:hypothetical protein
MSGPRSSEAYIFMAGEHNVWLREEGEGMNSGIRAVALFVIITSLQTARAGYARTWIVSTDGTGDEHSIQGAIEHAAGLDTVLVKPGVYMEAINFLGKGLVVRSTGGPNVTTIDATGANASVVRFINYEPASAVMSGFTLTGGTGSQYTDLSLYGGGILCTSGSPLIENNIITLNTADWGGGVFIGGYGSNPHPPAVVELRYNVVSFNRATKLGGGLYVTSSYTVIRDNQFISNIASFDGAGLSVRVFGGNSSIENNLVLKNSAGDHGGGMLLNCETEFGCTGIRVEGNIIASNAANGSDVGETGSGGGLSIWNGPIMVRHNTIVLNMGSGEVPRSGGGISMYGASAITEIDHNIVAFNQGCGMTCRQGPLPNLQTNIVWMNDLADLDIPECDVSLLQNLLITDPKFCGLEEEIYSVSNTSPALHDGEVYGAVGMPGCQDVPVVPTTWGAIKARFR